MTGQDENYIVLHKMNLERKNHQLFFKEEKTISFDGSMV